MKEIKKNATLKFLFLILVHSAIVLICSSYYAGELHASAKGSYFLFRPLEAKRLTGEVYLLSNVRCGIENAERPFKHSETVRPVWKTLVADADAIDDVFLIIEPLDATGYFCTHNGLWFEFATGRQVRDDAGYGTYGLVCSGQKLKDPKGDEYFLFQFSSKEDYFKFAYLTERDLRLYKLALDENQKKSLFYNAIRAASTRAANEKYHFVQNNCINNTFDLINSVLPSYQRFNYWLVYGIIFNPLFCLPDFNELIFRLHGLIAEKLPPFKGGRGPGGFGAILRMVIK